MSEVAVAVDSFSETLRTALEEGLERVGIQADVETEPVRTTLLSRAYVTSPQFAEMSYSERQEVLWSILRRALTEDDLLRVSIIYTMTPDELEGK